MTTYTMTTRFVKIENVNLPSNMKGTRVVNAITSAELLEKICQIYGFNEAKKSQLELWSGPLGYIGRQRLDTCEIIPEGYEYIWVRAVER